MHIGIELWPQNSAWPAMRETAQLVDSLGFDSLWVWDHFYAVEGEPERPNFEAWQILAAWAAVTRRAHLGALVSGVTYRHPAVIANMAATLDHVSEGRAIVGLGAAWHDMEHRAYGIELGTTGGRSRRLAEAAKIIRALLAGERVTYGGRYYKLEGAVLNVRPVQAPLPIMIGGGGEKQTLRTTARFADMWHGFGAPATMARKLRILRVHCADVGRDPAKIVAFASRGVVVREDLAEANRVLADVASHQHGMTPQSAIAGGPEVVAARLKAYWDVGVRGFIASFPYPYDAISIRRLAEEVRPRLRELTSTAT